MLQLFITRPIKKLHEATDIIANGNLDYQVDVDTSDEIGQLGMYWFHINIPVARPVA